MLADASVLMNNEVFKPCLVTSDSTNRTEYTENYFRELIGAIQRNEPDTIAVLNTIPEIVIKYDREMTILWANKATERVFKVATDKFLNQKCYELLRQVDKPCDGCPVVVAIETRAPQNSSIAASDGKLWFIRACPLFDKYGECEGAVEFSAYVDGPLVNRESFEQHRAELSDFKKRMPLLTEREYEVMKLVSDGRANKVIARELGISQKTVENHRAKVMAKLQCESLAALVRYYTLTKVYV
jgi:DNA-binding CsgD family transcriptional regulator